MYPTAHIRYKAVDGAVVVLDLRGGAYVILNRVATAMWKALVSTGDPAERVSRLTTEFDVPAGRLEADLTAFACDCVERGFLQVKPRSAHRRRFLPATHRRALVSKAWWFLALTRYRLARGGFGPTYKSYLELTRPAVVDDLRLAEFTSQAERAFLHAENFFPLRSAPKDCLPRSLSLYRFLLSIGLPARHCIGVRRFPFDAHAWVECGGRPLLDSPDEISAYAVLASM